VEGDGLGHERQDDGNIGNGAGTHGHCCRLAHHA
jgi:hypothetical protein